MIEVSNGATDAGGGDAQDPDHLVEAGSIGNYVSEDEDVQFVLVGKDGSLARETDEWETTEEAGADGGVVVLVTDRRLTFVVGDCLDPDVEGDDVRRVHLADVAAVDASDSFLSTSFSVRDASDVTLSITPTSMDDIEAVCQFVRRGSMHWEQARESFDGLEEAVYDIEAAVASGDADRAGRLRTRVLEALDDVATSSSLHSVDLPALDRDREAAERRVRAAFHRGYWSRTRELTEAGDEHRDDGATADAVEAYRDACASYRALVEEGGPTERTVEDAAVGEFDPFAHADALASRLADCRRDLADCDPATRLSGLQSIRSGYDDLAQAVETGGDRLNVDAGTQRNAIADAHRRIADAYERCAAACERRGDEADETDRSTAAYERALDALDERRRIAEDCGDVDPLEDAADRRETIEEKFERAQWEWVGDS